MKRLVPGTLLLLLMMAACNPSARDPRGAVIRFLNAVRASDTLAILRSVTMDAPYTIIADTGIETTSAFADTVMMARLAGSLTAGGYLHERWVDKQMVIGNSEMRGDDSALVEVSFISKRTGIQYYNKFGLVKRHRIWQIYSFKTQTGPSP